MSKRKENRCWCIPPDTLVLMSDGTQKQIKDVKEGDLVKTPSGDEKVIFTYYDPNIDRFDFYYIYTFSNGSKLRIVRDHRVYSVKLDKFEHLSKFEIGDATFDSNYNIVRLTNIERIPEYLPFCVIYTEHSSGYWANDILTGNIFSNFKWKWLRTWASHLYLKHRHGKLVKWVQDFFTKRIRK